MELPKELALRIDASVEERKQLLNDLSLQIHANPELRFEEKRASRWISEVLEKEGHRVERPLGGLATAFRARAGRGDHPRFAILAEYDALPEVGHACGHNLIAAGAVGAFLALAENIEQLGGSVEIIGTPAEEGGGGKVILLQAGVFDGVDAAVMFHPFDRDILAHPTLANLWLSMEFAGRPSHAAAAPWDGTSALTACIQTFNLIDSQRVHFRDGVRVHGFVTNGGQAVNIIPERAACEFSVRAKTLDELARVRSIVERCARGAAVAAGAEVTISERRGYRDLITNLSLARVMGKHLAELGRKPRERDDRVGTGSTDMGDVSHAVPAVHAWLGICGEGEALCHEHAFARAAASPQGLKTMLDAAKAMARTAGSFLSSAEMRKQVQAEFEQASV